MGELNFRSRKFLPGLGDTIMQILGPAVARRRALSCYFNGVINPRGQVPARITPVWYLHYLAHGVTQGNEISSGGVTRSQISFSVQHGDWKKVLLAVPWYVPRTWTKWSFLPIFSNRRTAQTLRISVCDLKKTDPKQEKQPNNNKKNHRWERTRPEREEWDTFWNKLLWSVVVSI